jgi:hypothetical protein
MTDDDSARRELRAATDNPELPGKSTQAERDAEAQALRDNMARLRALRLAREATEPTRSTAKKITRAKPGQKTKTGGGSSSKPEKKSQALSDWLASQQNGGRRI